MDAVPSATTLAPDPASSAAARRFATRWCAARGIHGDTVDTLLLLTAELVTNAVIHGRSDVTLSLARSGHRVRVSVGDENTRLPQRRDPDPDALDGRGLMLVEALAERHGIDVSSGGKTVWFDLVTTAPAERPRRRASSGCGGRVTA